MSSPLPPTATSEQFPSGLPEDLQAQRKLELVQFRWLRRGGLASNQLAGSTGSGGGYNAPSYWAPRYFTRRYWIDVPAIITTVLQVVTLKLPEVDTNYGVLVTVSWQTLWWITNKTTTTFQINFSVTSPVGSTYDWAIFRSE